VRSETFKLIHNLDPQARFYNGIAKTPYFREWEANARAGDRRAAELVERYYSPPEFELFDMTQDPLEQVNLAGDARYAPVMSELKTQLAAWMKEQGDLGHATEMAAYDRMLGGNSEAREAIRARKPAEAQRKRKSPPQSDVVDPNKK
jgi:uncharacterized sulfatase